MPAGIFTFIVEDFAKIPSPPQCLQGLPGFWPRPWQFGHAATVCITPKKVRCCWTTWPWPLQVAQVSNLLPGSLPEPLQTSQALCFRKEISLFFFPNTPPPPPHPSEYKKKKQICSFLVRLSASFKT